MYYVYKSPRKDRNPRMRARRMSSVASAQSYILSLQLDRFVNACMTYASSVT